MQIKSAAEIKLDADWQRLADIFFDAAGIESFSSAKNKIDFYEKYFGYYKKNYPAYFFGIYEKERIMGYICGAPNTKSDSFFYQKHAYLKKFDDSVNKFLAHLHINMHVDARGKGMGRLLMEKFERVLEANAVLGVHIVTAAGAENIRFYKYCGFEIIEKLENEKKSLLFMGKSLK